MARSARPIPDTEPLSATWRGVLSLLLFIHLFAVGVAMTSILQPSDLQNRLRGLFAPYLQTLNFEVTFLPYYLTHASLNDVDDRIELLPRGAERDDPQQWLVLPGERWAGSESVQRTRRLARMIGMLADQGDWPARVVQAIAEHHLVEHDLPIQELRARKRLLRSADDVAQGRPETEGYDRVSYAARVVIAGGNVHVVRIDQEARDVAQPTAAGEPGEGDGR